MFYIFVKSSSKQKDKIYLPLLFPPPTHIRIYGPCKNRAESLKARTTPVQRARWEINQHAEGHMDHWPCSESQTLLF